MVKNSITNKITPCCGLPFSVIYWWVSNLTLATEDDRQYILARISQTGILSVHAWRVLINSGTLEEDAVLTKSEFLEWFESNKKPSCDELRLIINSFEIGNWDPGSELPPNIATIDAVVNGANYTGTVYTKEQTDNKITDVISSEITARTIVSTDPPSGVPADGQQWIQYVP